MEYKKECNYAGELTEEKRCDSRVIRYICNRNAVFVIDRQSSREMLLSTVGNKIKQCVVYDIA